jgi:hypothetical protein
MSGTGTANRGSGRRLAVLLLSGLFVAMPVPAENTSHSDDSRSLFTGLFRSTPEEDDKVTRIRDTRSLLVDGVYRVGARIEFHINNTIREALDNGVPLVIELQVEVRRKRDWLWPETVAHLKVRYTIEYHALSRRYRVQNYSSGEGYNFGKLEEALAYIGNVYDLPVIDANLLQSDTLYKVRMRAVLDIESLPTPIRLWAYMGSDWSLRSDWNQWSLIP